MVSHPERPERGARFTFDRVDVDDARAEYRVTVAVATMEFATTALLRRDGGDIQLASWSPVTPEPQWIHETVRAFLKTMHANHCDDEPASWPRRVRRWRAPRGV